MVRETVDETVSGGPFDLVGSGLDAAGAKPNGIGGVGNALEWWATNWNGDYRAELGSALSLDLNRLHRRSGRSLAIR